MHLLAFDTSTERLSIALQVGARLYVHEGAGGAQASITLIPAICTLLADAGVRLAALDALVFGHGPGSFTGLRTACAVAQGLAFGAGGGTGLPVLPVNTLLAVAEQARGEQGCHQVLAALDARMNEVYWAPCVWQGTDRGWELQGDGAAGAVRLTAPTQVERPVDFVLAGNATAVPGPQLPAWPTATALLRLAPGLLEGGQAVAAAQALPLYVRDKVAQTMAERAAAQQQVL